jgi:uncharacterized protein (TIGR02996 family)
MVNLSLSWSVAVLEELLHAIVADPAADDRWLVLADWLEEHDDLRQAELLRLHRRLLDTCCEPAQHPQRNGWQARLVQLLAEGVRPCLPQRSVALGDDVAMTFSFIGPGTFVMGSPPDEEQRQSDEVPHLVTLTAGFWLGITPVTQAQWTAVMGSNPSRFKGPDRPVETVTWNDCQQFCSRASTRTGQAFRLPTEAEWEYACRAGTATPYYTGKGLDALQQAGWCSYDGRSGSAQQTKPVGQLLPNAWGLYDMHGNVLEWCADRFGAYPAEDVTDPRGPEEGEERVHRGGGWYSRPWRCRAALRIAAEPNHGCINDGCRVVLGLDGAEAAASTSRIY